MHPFMIVGVLLPAAALAVLAFFVGFVATKAGGGLGFAGKALAVWLVFWALNGIVFACFVPTGIWRNHVLATTAHEEASAALAALAFFVWFAATKASGWLRLAGKALGAWLVLLALVGHLFAPLVTAGMWVHYMSGMTTPDEAPAAATPANATP
jgi:hypothetical protein